MAHVVPSARVEDEKLEVIQQVHHVPCGAVHRFRDRRTRAW
jgi:hypothetical protein